VICAQSRAFASPAKRLMVAKLGLGRQQFRGVDQLDASILHHLPAAQPPNRANARLSLRRYGFLATFAGIRSFSIHSPSPAFLCWPLAMASRPDLYPTTARPKLNIEQHVRSQSLKACPLRFLFEESVSQWQFGKPNVPSLHVFTPIFQKKRQSS
jgi:hypothetical protein